MSELRARLLSIRTDPRAWSVSGAFVLHGLAFGLLTLWRPEPLPVPENTIPIILVELPTPLLEPEIDPEPVIEPVPELAPEATRTEAEQAPADETPPAPESDREDEAIPEVASASGAITVQVDEEDADAPEPEEDEELEIDPRYVVEFDPFAEVGQSAMARVVREMSCSRTNRDARPSFCPEFSDEQVYVAGLNRASAGQYAGFDPVYDAEGGRNLAEEVYARQAFSRSTGGSEQSRVTLIRKNEKNKRHPESLPGCTSFSSGALNGAEARNDLNLGSNDGIFCE